MTTLKQIIGLQFECDDRLNFTKDQLIYINSVLKDAFFETIEYDHMIEMPEIYHYLDNDFLEIQIECTIQVEATSKEILSISYVDELGKYHLITKECINRKILMSNALRRTNLIEKLHFKDINMTQILEEDIIKEEENYIQSQNRYQEHQEERY